MSSDPIYKTEDVAVVIPVYKTEMSSLENIGYTQCNKILQNYDRIIVAPKSLDSTVYKKYITNEIRFDDEFFTNLKSYNKLLLSEKFYKNFSKYRYILICQLDTFIFSDQLLQWCNKNYDYIGAPWINDSLRILSNIAGKYSIKECVKLFFRKGINKAVGNGGLSLRKVDTFLQCLKESNGFAKRWRVNEDYFWGLYAYVEGKPFNIPDYREAAMFSIELKPDYCLKLNHHQLPMGLHAWEKYKPELWKPFIKLAGYEF
jgi:hypothetical protein